VMKEDNNSMICKHQVKNVVNHILKAVECNRTARMQDNNSLKLPQISN
jgi:hypothetical protein